MQPYTVIHSLSAETEDYCEVDPYLNRRIEAVTMEKGSEGITMQKEIETETGVDKKKGGDNHSSPFTKSQEDLIHALRLQNKNLRSEVSEKESQLRELTDELSKIGSNGGNISDQFLLASLQAARSSLSALDSANQELLDALSSRQDEIVRLSTAGMSLQAHYTKATQKLKALQSEHSDTCKGMDELLRRLGNQEEDSDVTSNKIQELEGTIKEQKLQLENKNEEIMTMTKNLEEDEEVIAGLERELQEARDEFTKASDATALEEKICSLQDELKKALDKSITLEDALTLEKSKMEELNKMLVSGQQQNVIDMDKLDNEKKKLDSEILVLIEKLKNAEEDNKSLSLTNTELDEVIQGLKKELQSSGERKKDSMIAMINTNTDKDAAEMKEMIVKLSLQLDRFRTEALEINQRLADSQYQQGLKSSEIDLKSKEVVDLSKTLDAKIEEITVLTSKNSDLISQYEAISINLHKSEFMRDSLDKRCLSLQQEMELKDNELSNLRDISTKATIDLAKMSTLLEENRNFQQYQKSNSATTSEIESLKLELKHVSDQLDSERSEAARLLASLDDAKQTVLSRDSELASLRNAVSDEKDKYASQMLEFSKTSSNLEKELALAKNELQSARNSIASGILSSSDDGVSQEKIIVDLKHSCEELSQEIAKLWNELNVSQLSRKSTDDALLTASMRVTKLEDLLTRCECKSLKVEINSQREKIMVYEETISNLRNEVSETFHQGELTKKDMKLSTTAFELELKQAKENSLSLKATIENLMAKEQSLSSELKELSVCNSQLLELKNSLKSQVDVGSNKIEQLESEKSKLQLEISSTSNSLEEALNKLKETEATVIYLREELYKISVNVSENVDCNARELSVAMIKIKDLEQENKELVLKLNAEQSESAAQSVEYTRGVQKERDDFAELSKTLASKEVLIEGLRTETDKLKGVIDDLSGKIKYQQQIQSDLNDMLKNKDASILKLQASLEASRKDASETMRETLSEMQAKLSEGDKTMVERLQVARDDAESKEKRKLDEIVLKSKNMEEMYEEKLKLAAASSEAEKKELMNKSNELISALKKDLATSHELLESSQKKFDSEKTNFLKELEAQKHAGVAAVEACAAEQQDTMLKIQNDLEIAKKDILSKSNMTANNKKEIEEANDKIEELNVELTAAKMEIDHLNDQLRQSEHNAAQLEIDLQAAMAENVQLFSDMSILHERTDREREELERKLKAALDEANRSHDVDVLPENGVESIDQAGNIGKMSNIVEEKAKNDSLTSELLHNERDKAMKSASSESITKKQEDDALVSSTHTSSISASPTARMITSPPPTSSSLSASSSPIITSSPDTITLSVQREQPMKIDIKTINMGNSVDSPSTSNCNASVSGRPNSPATSTMLVKESSSCNDRGRLSEIDSPGSSASFRSRSSSSSRSTSSSRKTKGPSSLMHALDDHGKAVDIPHTIYMHVKEVTDLPNTGGVFSRGPNAYVLINGIKLRDKKKPCMGATVTSVLPQTCNPHFNEDCSLSMKGDGIITMSVFSQNTLSFPTFLGQAFINLSEHPELYTDGGSAVTLILPLTSIKHTIYSIDDGKSMQVVDNPKPQGSITITFKVPTIYSNINGWFRQINEGPFGITNEKIFVRVAGAKIEISESSYSKQVKRVIDCKKIQDFEDISYDGLEITIDALRITMQPLNEADLVPEQLIWAWAEDKFKLRSKWRKCLVDTHGSGIL